MEQIRKSKQCVISGFSYKYFFFFETSLLAIYPHFSGEKNLVDQPQGNNS